MLSGEAPDYLEAVIGYRAWHLDDEGVLTPWTFTALPWSAGINRAVCARDARHQPPMADCMCGLYALTDPGDRRLDFRADQAVGAIAAWGDLEVHRTGFRAQEACIVALALPDRAGVDQRDRLERAAARYAVPLVPAAELSVEARRHGAPLPDELWEPAWPAPRRADDKIAGLPMVDPAGFAAAARGIALDAHLWVETALGSIVLGLTGALADELGVTPRLALPEPGVALEAGDHAATVVGAGGAFGVWAPVAGSVLTVNPKLADDPGLLTRDPEGAGWLLRLAPRDWAREASAVAWGAGAARDYAACRTRDAAARGDAFADVRLERLHALPPVRSAADVLAALRAERAAPRFPDAATVDEQLGGRLHEALADDPTLRARLDRLDAVVRFTLTDPDAELTLDLRAQHQGSDPGRCIDLACSAEAAYRWFTGTLDAATAVRGGELRCSAGAAAALRTLALLKHLRVPTWDPAPSWAR